MSPEEKFRRFQELEALGADKPSDREMARQCDVTPPTIANWRKNGWKPRNAERVATVEMERHVRKQVAKAMESNAARSAFDKALIQWIETYPQLALQLPVKRLSNLQRMDEIIAQVRAGVRRDGQGRTHKLKSSEIKLLLTEFRLLDKAVTQSRREDAHLLARGMPDILRTLMTHFQDLAQSSVDTETQTVLNPEQQFYLEQREMTRMIQALIPGMVDPVSDSEVTPDAIRGEPETPPT